jgi:hypothetical protein
MQAGRKHDDGKGVTRKRAIAVRLCYKKQNLSIAVIRLIYTG